MNIKEVKRHQYIIVLLVIVVVVVVFSLGTQLSVIINLLTGHEVIVNVKADNEAMPLLHGEKKNITFESRVFTSLFCTPSCTSTFSDVSSDEIIEKDTFVWKNAKAFKKSYAIEPKRTGAGQELYRFTLSCHNLASVLCKSEERATVQNVLVAASYDLTENEKTVKDELRLRLGQLIETLNGLQGRLSALDRTLIELGYENNSDIRKILEGNVVQLAALNNDWVKQDFAALEWKTETLNASIAKTEAQIDALQGDVREKVNRYNAARDDLRSMRSMLEEFSDGLFVEDVKLLNTTIEEFNVLVDIEMPGEGLVLGLMNVSQSMKQRRDRAILKSLLELDIAKDTLCIAKGNCLNHTPIEERAVQQVFDAHATCTDIKEFNAVLKNTSDVNVSLNVIMNNITAHYIQKLNKEMQELLTKRNVTVIDNLEVDECTKADITIELGTINSTKKDVAESMPGNVGITFDEPSLQCCVFGECKACCADCRDKYYPVVFLHGHALSRDVSYEYSLDVFNDIQQDLEEEGYLNAGSISLYTSRTTPPGIWGLMKAPVTIRLSYYFDRFQHADNYVPVQTKSDNIDVYALRMKELIELVQEKTGKIKVNIVAYSMGGLVARRYIQIFGSENVNKLIMIGTPNHGVVGDTADYCGVLGEDRECKDMNADSLFINKLNSGELPGIPIYNIVGTGCVMGVSQGDGVVLEKSAWLDGATNYVVKGECTTLGKLHADLLELEKHPEVFDIVKEALKEQLVEST